MVNTGRPSRGCILCRKRKIKCDENRPSCRNCAKYGRPCPGYPVQTPPVSHPASHDCQRVKKQTTSPVMMSIVTHSYDQVKRAKCSPEADDKDLFSQEAFWDQIPEFDYITSSSTSPMPQTTPFTCSQLPVFVFPDPEENIEEKAINCLYTSGVLSIIAGTASDISSADLIWEMCQESGPLSSLNRAVKATALANLANRIYRPDLRMQALHEYDQALVALKEALADPRECLEDQTMATLLVMRLCELLFGFNSQVFSPSSNFMPLDDWQSHVEGMHALLRIRGLDQLSTHRGRWLFEATCKAVRLRTIMQSQVPDNTLGRLENEFVSGLAGPVWPLTSASTFYLQTASKLRAQISELVNGSSSHTSLASFAPAMDALIAQARGLDKKVVDWLDRNKIWHAQDVTLSHTTRARYPDAKALARQCFADPGVLLHRGRMAFMRVGLQATLVCGLSAKLEVLEREQARTGLFSAGRVEGQATSSCFAAIDRDILACVQVAQSVAVEMLGWVACGLGEVDENGELVVDEERKMCWTVESQKLGLRTMECYVHLASLQRCELLSEEVLRVVGGVLGRIVDGFRT